MKELLKKIDLLSDLSDQELEAVMAIAHREHYPKGSVVASEGSPCSSFFIVYSGRANLLETIAGQESPEVVLEKFDSFGQECLFRDKLQCPKVVAYEDLEIIRFNKDEFQNLAMRMPDIASKMLRKVEKKPPEEVEGNKFFSMIASLENRLLVELNSAMLLLKEIDAKYAETIDRVEKRSSETIAWVESRSKDIDNRVTAEIAAVEKRSLETFDWVEKRGESLEKRVSDTISQIKLESAALEKRLATSLEDGKQQAAQVVSELQAESAKIIHQAQTERKWVKTGWKIITVAFTLIVTAAGWLGIKEFPKIDEKIAAINKMYADLNTMTGNLKTKEKEIHDASRDAKVIRRIVLDLAKVRQFSRLIDDNQTLDPDELRKISLSFEFHRDNLFKEYFVKYMEFDSDNLLETMDIYLKMTRKGEVRLGAKEIDSITKIFFNKILSDIPSRPPQDWQFRLKIKENLISFGQLLQDTNMTQYHDFIENLHALLKIEDPQGGKYIRYTLAETLVELHRSNEDVRQVLRDMLQKELRPWPRTIAAMNLVRLGDREPLDFLFQEIKKTDSSGLRKAILLAEMIKKDKSFPDQEKSNVVKRLEKGHRDLETDKFTKLYVEHLLAEIKAPLSAQESHVPK